jgi:hypothetical protein
MLTRARWAASLCLVALMATWCTTEIAAARLVKQMKCTDSGFCTWVLVNVRDTPPTRDSKTIANKRRCVDRTANLEVACTGDPRGRWSNVNQCFIRKPEVIPPKSDPIWGGHTDGSIWRCIRIGIGFSRDREARQMSGMIWMRPGARPPVVVDPLALVEQAIAKMQLGKPVIGIVPKPTPESNEGAVNLPVWMWTGRGKHDVGPLSAAAAIPGVLSVTATAKVTRIVWTMGDGGSVTCAGPGTQFDPSYGATMSPTCGYKYEQTSDDQRNGRYTVTARSDWTIQWTSSDGDRGDLTRPLSSSVSIKIGELRPVLVDPGR